MTKARSRGCAPHAASAFVRAKVENKTRPTLSRLLMQVPGAAQMNAGRAKLTYARLFRRQSIRPRRWRLTGVKVKDLETEHVARWLATDRKEEPYCSPPQQSATQTDPITFLNRQAETSSRDVCHAQRSEGVSLVLSWRPDQERTRRPAGTGDLDVDSRSKALTY